MRQSSWTYWPWLRILSAQNTSWKVKLKQHQGRMASCSTALLQPVSLPGILPDQKIYIYIFAYYLMAREHPGGSELWAEAGRMSDPPPEQVAFGAEFPSPLPSLGGEIFPFHILLRAPREATAASWGPFTCSSTFSPPRHQDLRIQGSLSCLRSYILQLHLNADLQGPLYPLTALYFLTLGLFPLPFIPPQNLSPVFAEF